MNDLASWLERLERRHATPIQLGLDRVQQIRQALNCSSDAVLITVGGTNGKGSVCAMLEAILKAAGFRVGLYTSPHLLRYTERVRVNGDEVTEAQMVEALEAVETVRGEVPLTYFEHCTLAAWKIFCDAKPDVIILEVGLGGCLDAVNIFDADCSVITSVAMDHMEYLGDNREAIGHEKAGIFRPGRPAVCSDPLPPASVLAHAESLGTPLWISGRDFGFGGDRQQWGYWRYEAPHASGRLLRRGGLAYPTLRGANQLLNAAAVLTTLDLLRDRIPVSMQAVRQGLMLVDLPGRFQVLPGRPAVVLDVAHNPQAVGVLSENLSNMGFFPETWAVFGMLSDKDVEGVVALIRDRIDHWLIAGLPGGRGMSAQKMAERLSAVGIDVQDRCFDLPREAFDAAQHGAAESDRIVVFGSFLTVADVMAGMNAARVRS
ncbi:bifunctional tetrahydrofolate synthase/dihydrofolate synthase [Rhodocyclaceae bacterium SMB388]